MARSKARDGDDDDGDSQRLDKWLVYARFVKTRSVALELISKGRVRLNNHRETKPDRHLEVGDVLTLALPHATEVVSVQSLALKRGSATEAGTLYQRLESIPATKSSDMGQRQNKSSFVAGSFSKKWH